MIIREWCHSLWFVALFIICPANKAINLLLIVTFRALAADHHQATWWRSAEGGYGIVNNNKVIIMRHKSWYLLIIIIALPLVLLFVLHTILLRKQPWTLINTCLTRLASAPEFSPSCVQVLKPNGLIHCSDNSFQESDGCQPQLL